MVGQGQGAAVWVEPAGLLPLLGLLLPVLEVPLLQALASAAVWELAAPLSAEARAAGAAWVAAVLLAPPLPPRPPPRASASAPAGQGQQPAVQAAGQGAGQAGPLAVLRVLLQGRPLGGW